MTRADKSLPWAINRIKEQQQRQALLPHLCFFPLLCAHLPFPNAVILKTFRTTGPIDPWNNKEPNKGRILLSRWNIESGYRSELKVFQMFKAIPVWPRGTVYCLGHLSQGYGNIVYMVGKRPCVYTDVLSFQLTDLPAASRTTIFSATGHMHFALVYPLIQKWRRASSTPHATSKTESGSASAPHESR